jgi:hypothetical protein
VGTGITDAIELDNRRDSDGERHNRDDDKSAETFGSVAKQWFNTKAHRQPKTIAGYRSLLETIVLPKWGDVPLKRIDYESYSTWLGGLSVCRLPRSWDRLR